MVSSEVKSLYEIKRLWRTLRISIDTRTAQSAVIKNSVRRKSGFAAIPSKKCDQNPSKIEPRHFRGAWASPAAGEQPCVAQIAHHYLSCGVINPKGIRNCLS